MNLTCNSTLDDLRILPTSEIKVAGSLTFHELALTIGGAATAVAILTSLFLIWMHALHYTKPNEQKHIIRILFMVPVYSTSSWLSIRFYWHAIYFQVISDCYEAFAISSFFALLCSYVASDLHEQKNYFRDLRDIKPWVWPLNWFSKCCGGQRGPWRTPVSGLTWFNIIWIGIYHYCFIRVAMTITAVVTQYFGRYCESSNNPVFAHIWVIVIEAIAVTIAMYCVIQFYVQLRTPLSEHSPFLKVLAIKLVIFLSFWQSSAISVGTSTLNFLKPNKVLAYPDIKVGIPSLLLCVEMALFAILHIWAFPYRPYLDTARVTFYPIADPDGLNTTPKPNEHTPRSGGAMGFHAIFDALNLWDVVKAFGRGLRWLFVGVHKRRDDISYQKTHKAADVDMDDLSQNYNGRKPDGPGGVMGGNVDTAYHPRMKSTEHLPIATEFRRSRFGMLNVGGSGGYNNNVAATQGDRVGGTVIAGAAPGAATGQGRRQGSDEAAGLIAYAQPMSASTGGREQYHDQQGAYRQGGSQQSGHQQEDYPQTGSSYNAYVPEEQEPYVPQTYTQQPYAQQQSYGSGRVGQSQEQRQGQSQGQNQSQSQAGGHPQRGYPNAYGRGDVQWGEAR